MQEDDGVPGLEELLGARGAAGAGAEVVNVADRLALERDRGAARGDEDDAAVGGGVGGDEAVGEGDVGFEVARRRVLGEVGLFCFEG